jgi:thermostable 8-oxoguanine DNA glycosylase
MEPQQPTKPTMITEPVESFFDSIKPEETTFQYNYWGELKPINDTEKFQRWLFAFMSVHTSWERNIIGYNNIKHWWNWINRWDHLENKLIESRVGMQNNRTKYIKEFTIKFWSNPSYYDKGEGETWVMFRNRLVNDIKGLGMAKVSFALEMIHPTNAEIVCLDTHLFQAYGLDQTKHRKQYKNLENHWVENSRKKDLPPYIARCIYWDRKQEKEDSRYWSHVLEEGDFFDDLKIKLN